MKSLKTGVVIVSPFQSTSIPLIKSATQNSEVLSNQPLGIPYHRLMFVDVPTQNTTRYVFVEKKTLPKAVFQYPEVSEMMAIEALVDRMIVVTSDVESAGLLALVVASTKETQPIKFIIGNQVYNAQAVLNQLTDVQLHDLKLAWASLQPNNDNQQPSELLTSPNGAQLFPYQQQMVDFILRVKRGGLFVDMGLGKTFATLATIDKLAHDKQIDVTKPILIVAPKMVALDTWSREAAKWGYDMDVSVNIGLTPKKRNQLLDSLLEPQDKPHLLTTNPEQIEPITKYFYQHGDYSPFSMVVVDELSQYKNGQTKRFKTLRKISDKTEYFIGLTGTPNPNTLLDIWSEMMVIDPANNGRRLGHQYYQYRNRFFIPESQGPDGTVYSWKLKQGAKQKIYNALKPSAISMSSDGLVELPAITYTNQYVKLPKKAQKLYDDLDGKIRNKLREITDPRDNVHYEGDDTNFDIANSATLASRLMQVTSGAIYDGILNDIDKPVADDMNIEAADYQIIHDVKMEALKEIIDNATSPVLVFFKFKSELIRMKKFIDFEYLNPHDKNVQGIISRWNQGKIPVLVANPAAAGHGLNLQDGGHIMVWYTTTWSNEQYRQAVKRLYRRGQKQPVSVIHLIAEDTIDEEIIDRLNAKESQQSELMDTLKVEKRG